MNTGSRSFWAGVAVGAGGMLVLGSATLVGIGTLLTGPQLALQVTIPDTVLVAEPFVIEIDLSNPHHEAVTFDNLDIPDRILGTFDVLDVEPSASSASPIGGFGSQTWYFESEVPPGGRRAVKVRMRARRTGPAPVQFDICNAYEDCSTVVRSVYVVGKGALKSRPKNARP